MSEITALREQIDRRIRPGQAGTATVANRAPAGGVLAAGGTLAGDVYHPETGETSVRARYGRGRYGVGRY